MVWICPKCAEPLASLSQESQTIIPPLTCLNGHQYDRARQGYVHLLLANQKGSHSPGDNGSMINARRQFLRAGFYEPLVDAVTKFTFEQTLLKDNGFVLLDLGCGEGYYLESVLTQAIEKGIVPCVGYGIDISKFAIRKAASSAKHIGLSCADFSVDYAVASGFKLPVADQSINVILNVFAPCAIKEVQRCLKKDGYFIRVAPGPRHLYQLKSLIYQEARLHQTPEVDSGFELIKEQAVHFEITLESSAVIEQLLMMTPFNWHGKGQAKNQLIAQGNLTSEIDFLIQYCQLK